MDLEEKIKEIIRRHEGCDVGDTCTIIDELSDLMREYAKENE